MRIGFIGTGSMGSLLIEALLNADAVGAENMSITNRTRKKAQILGKRFPGLDVADTNRDVAQKCDWVFLCVKPTEYKAVLQDIRSVMNSNKLLISITSPVMIRHLEDHLDCKVMKMIPSITNHVHSGVTLCMFGERMTDTDKTSVEKMLAKISLPVLIPEQFARVSSDLSSCGPAFLAYFIEHFIEAAVNETGLPAEEANFLASEMVLGTGRLLTTGRYRFSPSAVRESVSVPGGITFEGLRMMEKRLDGMFEELIQATHAKYDNEKEKIETQLYGTRT